MVSENSLNIEDAKGASMWYIHLFTYVCMYICMLYMYVIYVCVCLYIYLPLEWYPKTLSLSRMQKVRLCDISTYINILMFVYINIYMCMSIGLFMYFYIYQNGIRKLSHYWGWYKSKFMWWYILIYVCMYVCMCVFVYIFTTRMVSENSLIIEDAKDTFIWDLYLCIYVFIYE
jgi:hypothetical protein